uniref:BGAL7 n=1 Tax=Arundo donax TaxID=35708 RepID=A0A0A9CRD1_ARUDO
MVLYQNQQKMRKIQSGYAVKCSILFPGSSYHIVAHIASILPCYKKCNCKGHIFWRSQFCIITIYKIAGCMNNLPLGTSYSIMIRKCKTKKRKCHSTDTERSNFLSTMQAC